MERKKEDGLWEGHTPEYVPVGVACAGERAGDIVTVTVTGVQGQRCLGEVLQ
ncbi:MAG: hypothetical protein IKM39_01220 [Clostridia bacterium]|nr:hypothetical protein [Clostridia bacterium]